MTTETKLKLHNITSKPALKYGSENWVMNKRDTQRLEAAQMRFLRPLSGHTRLDRQQNKDIRKTLKVTNIIKEIQQYQKNWKRHLQRMDKGRLPQLALRY
jgi:predicted deacetylase